MASDRSRRMTTESSTTSTRILRVGRLIDPTTATCPRTTSAVNGFMMYSLAPAARLRTSGPCPVSVVTISTCAAVECGLLSNSPQQLQAVHPRHVPVDQNQIRRSAGRQHGQRFESVFRLQDLKPCFASGSCSELPASPKSRPRPALAFELLSRHRRKQETMMVAGSNSCSHHRSSAIST